MRSSQLEKWSRAGTAVKKVPVKNGPQAHPRELPPKLFQLGGRADIVVSPPWRADIVINLGRCVNLPTTVQEKCILYIQKNLQRPLAGDAAELLELRSVIENRKN